MSHDVALQRQHSEDRFRDSRVVFGYEHAGALGQRHATLAGPDGISCVPLRRSVTVNVAPPSGLLRAPMVPRCASTIVCVIVSPIPSPCALVVTNGANSAPSMCAGKPLPASPTETATSAALNSVRMV